MGSRARAARVDTSAAVRNSLFGKKKLFCSPTVATTRGRGRHIPLLPERTRYFSNCAHVHAQAGAGGLHAYSGPVRSPDRPPWPVVGKNKSRRKGAEPQTTFIHLAELSADFDGLICDLVAFT